MLLRDGRNLLGTFRVKSAPSYIAESKNGRAYCKFYASTRAAVDKEESEDLEYEVIILGDPAIPASKTILPGALLLIGGRTAAGEYYRKDKITIFVDFWQPVVQDPYNYLEILKTQMQMLANGHLGRFYQAVGGEEGGEQPEGE